MTLPQPGQSSSKSLMPILTLMVEMTQANRTIRKFIRLRILPPLRDVSKRPEEGHTIRNKLCSLMTSPLHDLKHLSANFLFILCKESGKFSLSSFVQRAMIGIILWTCM